MKSNVKIYNNSNLDTKVVGYGGSTIPIKIYHNSLDYQTGNFVSMTFSVNDSSMWRLSPPPIAPSQLGFESPAIRFDRDEVVENDFDAWTVAAEASKGYKFAYWLLNWEGVKDNVMYILREDSIIQAVFKPADMTIEFFNDAMWQWKDSLWNKINTYTISSWEYRSFTQYKQNVYLLLLKDYSSGEDIELYYQYDSSIQINYLMLNWQKAVLPTGISDWDMIQVNVSQLPWVYIVDDSWFWHWINTSTWDEVTFIPAYSSSTINFNVSIYSYDNASHSAIIHIYNWRDNMDIKYECKEQSAANDVEIVWLCKDDLSSITPIVGSGSTQIPVWWYLIWAMLPIWTKLAQVSNWATMKQNALTVPCISAQYERDVMPDTISYMFEDYRTHLYCWFLWKRNDNQNFMAAAFDNDWRLINSKCYSYSSNPYWITYNGRFLNSLNDAFRGWYSILYYDIIRDNVPMYSNTQLVDMIMEELHL